MRYVDEVTHEPCPTRGNLLCTIPNRDHRHIAEHMIPTAPEPVEQAAEVRMLAFLAEHRRNEIEDIIGGRAPARWRVKCDGDRCSFYAEADRWYDACAAHEAHLTAALRAAGLLGDGAALERVRVHRVLAEMCERHPEMAEWAQTIEAALGDRDGHGDAIRGEFYAMADALLASDVLGRVRDEGAAEALRGVTLADVPTCPYPRCIALAGHAAGHVLADSPTSPQETS